MKHTRILLWLLVALLPISCARPVPNSTPTDISATLSPSPNLVPSMSPAADTLTPVPAQFEIRTFCPEIDVQPGALPSMSGTMVLSGEDILLAGQDHSDYQDQGSILLFWTPDGDQRTVYPLPDRQRVFYFVTSPNKQELAFTQGKTLSMTTEVFVLGGDGLRQASFSLLDDWTLFDWLNNEQLLVRQTRKGGEDIGLVAVNPYTGEQLFMPSNFPNLYTRPVTIWGAQTIFDPTASLVVYPQLKGNQVLATLWNVRAGKEVTSLIDGDWPRWSPDGSRLLMSARLVPERPYSDEIYIITNQGQVTRSTFFDDYMTIHAIDFPTWSPDAHAIAFWLRTKMEIPPIAQLAILDVATSQVDLYCMEVNPLPFRMGEDITLGYSYAQVNGNPLIWSPDGKFILIESRQSSNGISNTYLVDLQNHTITLLAKNARPVGWMK